MLCWPVLTPEARMKITILVGILALIAFDSTVVTSESQAKVQVGQKFPPAKQLVDWLNL
jgi:hypothetical protein